MHYQRCVIRYKDTNLKAIHNVGRDAVVLDELCHPIQRYKFESNSQLGEWHEGYTQGNLKAIHNALVLFIS